MLRMLRKKCFHCSKFHSNIKIHTFYSTSVPKKVEIDIGGTSKLEISSGRLARMADGSAVVRIGNTAVMTTVVSKGKLSNQNFLPLTVDYRQKAAAAGRIPTNYLRRELGPSDREILVGRMVDRSVRPLFNKTYNTETGITCNLLSVDGVHNPEVASICAASAALSLSDVPWGPAVGAVQLGYLNGQVVVNPTRKQLAKSELNLMLAGTSGGLATMLEGDARSLNHQDFLNAIKVGLEKCAIIAQNIESLGRQIGKPKRAVPSGEGKEESITLSKFSDTSYNMEDIVETLGSGQLTSIYTDHTLDKQARDKKMFAVRDKIFNQVLSINPSTDTNYLNDLFFHLSRKIVRNLIFQENVRVDGRSPSDIRNISCEVDLHSPLHGSALFQRGQTQVLCTVALDSLQSALKLDPISALTGGLKEKNFMLHYEFPNYATGDLGKSGARRELGHGALAERAIRQVMPASSQFTIRLTSEVLESNGSSSMASICGGSLALLDAGVGLSELVSGVAMGLVHEQDGGPGQDTGGAGDRYKVLTDIMGMEDFLGDMDFKLAATRSGVCALQADFKLPGVSLEVIEKAIEGGVDANHKILGIMENCINTPRKSKDCWPVTSQLEVPAHQRAKFVGQAGLNLRKLTQETGVQVYGESDGVWQLFASNPEAMSEAEAIIENLLKEEKVPELEFGGIYTGKITEILDRGVMIQLHEQISPVMLHVVQLSATPVKHPSALGLKVGQDLQVKYYGRDPVTGQIRLSRKALLVSSAAAVKNLQKSTKRKDDQQKPPPTSQGDAGGGDAGAGVRPRLVINENKKTLLSQADYNRITSENATSSNIVIQNLFTTKDDADNTKQVVPDNTVNKYGDNVAEKHEILIADNNKASDNRDDSVPQVTTDENLSNRMTAALNIVGESEPNDNLEMDKSGEEAYEEIYYRVDKQCNQLMSVKSEIEEATIRKQKVDDELKSQTEILADIENSPGASKDVVKSFHADKVKICKSLSEQSKAINETLILLTRQYRDIKQELDLDRARLALIQSQNPGLHKELKFGDISPALTCQVDPATYTQQSTDNAPASEETVEKEDLKSVREEDDKDVILGLVKATVRRRDMREVRSDTISAIQIKPHSGIKNYADLFTKIDNTEVEEDQVKIPSSWNNAFPVLSAKEQDQDKHLLTDTEEEHLIDEDEMSLLNPEQRRTISVLNEMIAQTQGDDELKRQLRNEVNYWNSANPHSVYEQRRLMVTGNERLSDPRIDTFVNNCQQDFNTVFKWYTDLSDSDQLNEKTKDLFKSMQEIRRLVKRNLSKLERYSYETIYYRSRIDFIESQLKNYQIPLIQLSRAHLDKLESIYDQVLSTLEKDKPLDSIASGVGCASENLWLEFHKENNAFSRVLKSLWEVELSEERMADMDEWRQEGEDSNIQQSIDKLQDKIDSYTKKDMQKNWEQVEKDLRTMQGLKVSGTIMWLQQSSSLPDWLNPDLKEYLLVQCQRYTELDKQRRENMASWLNFRSKDDSLDLSLDMLYSQIRTCIAKVRYTNIENSRHKTEINFYSSWIDRNGKVMKSNHRDKLKDMINAAAQRIQEVDEAVELYTASLKFDQEEIRSSATLLDKMREEKRALIWEAGMTIMFLDKKCIKNSDWLVKRKGVYISEEADDEDYS